MSGLDCGHNNCKPGLGYAEGTNCCYNKEDYCSEFLIGGNGTWTLGTPTNNSNEFVFDVTCLWNIDVITNTHVSLIGSQSSSCGVANPDWGCCTSSDPCKFGDGDCDSDIDCEGALVCRTDNCGLAFPSGFDCCVLDNTGVSSSDIVVNIELQTFEVRHLVTSNFIKDDNSQKYILSGDIIRIHEIVRFFSRHK